MRALVENMQVELNMAHARLYDEMQSQIPHASSPKWVSVCSVLVFMAWPGLAWPSLG